MCSPAWGRQVSDAVGDQGLEKLAENSSQRPAPGPWRGSFMGKAHCQLPVQPSLLPALSCAALSGSPECVSAPSGNVVQQCWLWAGDGPRLGRGKHLTCWPAPPRAGLHVLPLPPPQASGSRLLSVALPAFERRPPGDTVAVPSVPGCSHSLTRGHWGQDPRTLRAHPALVSLWLWGPPSGHTSLLALMY